MLRYAVGQDLAALCRLRCAVYGGTLQDAAGWLQYVAGLSNTLLLESESGGAPTAMLAAIPVTYGLHRGIWLRGIAVQPGLAGEELVCRLTADCVRAFAASGCEFALATPRGSAAAGQLEQIGFRNVLPRRVVLTPIARNLLATAEFDALTVPRLIHLRGHYQPGALEITEESLTETMTQLYRRGLTTVCSRRGYGLFYTGEDTLQFLELQADNDHSADLLLQAAAEHTGIHRAQLVLAENQTLYLGAGRRCGYGMLCFLHGKFPVRDLYFSQLL